MTTLCRLGEGLGHLLTRPLTDPGNVFHTHHRACWGAERGARVGALASRIPVAKCWRTCILDSSGAHVGHDPVAEYWRTCWTEIQWQNIGARVGHGSSAGVLAHVHPGLQWQSVGHGFSGARVGHDSSVGVLDMIPVADVLDMIPSRSVGARARRIPSAEC